MNKKFNSVSNELFNELFDKYWRWLRNRFNSLGNGRRIFYSPMNGNSRYIESMNHEIIKMKEASERSFGGEAKKNELQEDFYKLCCDPEIGIRDSQNRIKEIRKLAKKHDIKNLVEFKREIFEEFEEFARKNHFDLFSCCKLESVYIEREDLSSDQIDEAIKSNRLLFGYVETGNKLAIQRQRRGQDRLRQLTLGNYDFQCAICEISDSGFLIASHIFRWSDSPASRGNLSNIICLCKLHDALFEQGYWSLKDNFSILINNKINSQTIELILNNSVQFRKPKEYPPGIYFLQEHRSRCGFN